jgi:hypothetical protein
MTPGIVGVEGTPLGHDALSPELAIAYLETPGHTSAVNYLKKVIPLTHTYSFTGSSSKTRHIFDATVVSLLHRILLKQCFISPVMSPDLLQGNIYVLTVALLLCKYD